jgi:uncharacterized membrane protein
MGDEDLSGLISATVGFLSIFTINQFIVLEVVNLKHNQTTSKLDI